MAADPAHYNVRQAEEKDLDALAAFEIAIARISFPEDPVVDPEVHKKKLLKALGRDHAGMFVAENSETGAVVGWLWVALNSNFLTGDRYANFRSLAVTQGAESAEIAELLFARGIEYARSEGVEELTGKVHVSNVSMRLIYRKFGFHAEHLTMKLRLGE